MIFSKKKNIIILLMVFIMSIILLSVMIIKYEPKVSSVTENMIYIEKNDINLDINDSLEISLLFASYIFTNDQKMLISSQNNILMTNHAGQLFIYELHITPMLKSVKLNKTELEMVINSEDELNYVLEPSNIYVSDVKWTSSDSNIVSVTDGKVTAIGIGEADITLMINNISVTCHIKVKPIEIDSIKLDKTFIKLEQGDSTSLNTTIEPDNVADKSVIWKSGNKNIALVDKKGKVTAQGVGTTDVTVTTSNGKKATCKVTVTAKEAKSIRLDKDDFITKIGTDIRLYATILPTNTYNKKISWTSSDPSIATVSNGLIIGRKPGKVVITATTSNGKRAKSTITFESNTHNKTAIFFGDSITYGYKGTPVGYSWANYIGDHYDLKKTVNAGKSGWCISNVKGKYILDQVKKYDNQTFDYVIMHGGTNDISRGTPLGTYDPTDFSGHYDDKTFLGGLETYIYTIKHQFPKAKIGYIINYPTPNSNVNRKKLSATYYTQMKKVLSKWNISYLDLFFGTSPDKVKYSRLLKVNTSTYLPDALHLNRDGYKLISPYIYRWMNTL